MEGFNAWWSMEGKGEAPFHLFTFSHFPIRNFTSTFIFFLWSRGFTLPCSRPLFIHFLPFPWPINYNCASRCKKSFIHSLSIWFWLKIFFSFLEIMVSHMATFTGFKLHKWMKNRLRSHLWIWRWCNILVMKTLNHERCVFILKLILLELGTIAFFWTFAPWWFCYKSTMLLVMNLKLSMKFVVRLKTPLFLHGIQFSTLDIIVGCAVRLANCFLITR